MKRSNPKKGRDEDPGFVPIGWDEAFDLIAAQLNRLRAEGLTDASGYPRRPPASAAAARRSSTWAPCPPSWPPGGRWTWASARARASSATTPSTCTASCGTAPSSSPPTRPAATTSSAAATTSRAAGGVVGIWRHADARVRGMKRVQVEPHLSVTGACSAQWVPIKPKTDAAFLYALIHVMLHEAPRSQLDLPHLAQRTSSPPPVGAHGYYLRERATRKPLVWDESRRAPCRTTRRASARPCRRACRSTRSRSAPTTRCWPTACSTADRLRQAGGAHGAVSPEWAAGICDVPAATMRTIAQEYLAHACVGQTVTIGGKTLPFRPVAVTLGKTVNNGWGGYECCWARTLLATLVGALGCRAAPSAPRCAWSSHGRAARQRARRRRRADGLPFNPTSKERWSAQPNIRNAYKTMVPLTGNNAWAQALGPTHFSWMFLDNTPKGLPRSSRPTCGSSTAPTRRSRSGTRPAWRPRSRASRSSSPSPTRATRATISPTCCCPTPPTWKACSCCPAATKYQEQFWEHEGFALRQPVVAPRGEARDFTDICTELARRCGILEKYNAAINRGTCGVSSTGPTATSRSTQRWRTAATPSGTPPASRQRRS